MSKKYPGSRWRIQSLTGNVEGTSGICEASFFVAGLFVACIWQFATPIEYTADSGTYMSVARMLIGRPPGDMPFIFRSSGYPIFLVLTGVPVLRTFHILMLVQTLMAALIPVMVYRLLHSAGHRIALAIGKSRFDVEYSQIGDNNIGLHD